MVGEVEAAVELLDLLLSVPSTLSVEFFRLDPRLDGIRDDPRFVELLEKEEYAGQMQ